MRADAGRLIVALTGEVERDIVGKVQSVEYQGKARAGVLNDLMGPVACNPHKTLTRAPPGSLLNNGTRNFASDVGLPNTSPLIRLCRNCDHDKDRRSEAYIRNTNVIFDLQFPDCEPSQPSFGILSDFFLSCGVTSSSLKAAPHDIDLLTLSVSHQSPQRAILQALLHTYSFASVKCFRTHPEWSTSRYRKRRG